MGSTDRQEHYEQEPVQWVSLLEGLKDTVERDMGDEI